MEPVPQRLRGKRAIVTGAASGIGRATALRFALEGARVVCADVDARGLDGTRDALGASLRDRLELRVADAADDAAVRALVDEAERALGGLDVVFANAGVSGRLAPFWELDVDEWERVLRVNLIGPFLALKHAVPAMRRAGGGAFVATASVAGLRSGAGPTPYSASKAGVVSLVQTSAHQLRGTGIRVNAVCPGLVETGMTQPLFDAARASGKGDRIGQLNPLERPGETREIAAVVAFLASDDASYVNGQAIPVCGGLSASHPAVVGRLF
ncbi:MAG: SDR family oxidoreductase [Myxococcales bacterium]|nr:SDR family oxidoreductase [Myxococcales bacterium]